MFCIRFGTVESRCLVSRANSVASLSGGSVAAQLPLVEWRPCGVCGGELFQGTPFCCIPVNRSDVDRTQVS